jgi:hypothetical protein
MPVDLVTLSMKATRRWAEEDLKSVTCCLMVSSILCPVCADGRMYRIYGGGPLICSRCGYRVESMIPVDLIKVSDLRPADPESEKPPKLRAIEL